MDDFGMQGPELTDALERIAWINRILGGNKLTMDAVRKLAKARPGQKIRILDLGCGNGDMLRALGDMGKKEGLHFRMHGIDANPFTVQYAQRLSSTYPGISYACGDMLEMDWEGEEWDIVLLTLTLHHFTDEQIKDLLQPLLRHTHMAIVVNDLQRSVLAYRLFGLLSFVFRLGRVNSVDGKLSILRGFKRAELEQLAQQLKIKKHTIRWKWAFRYQWIITGL